MFSFLFRNLSFVTLLALAIGVPYLMHTGDWDKVRTYLSFSPSNDNAGTTDWTTAETETMGAKSPTKLPAGSSPGASLSGPEVRQLQTVLRFDITPDWVARHWSRVSVLDVDGMQAYRVPLVSGVQLHDLAGALTYSFDEHGVLQRINFKGVTGDASRIERVASTAFRLEPEFDVKRGLSLARWNGRPTSYLLVESNSVVRTDAPHENFLVTMEINRPRAYSAIGDEFAKLAAEIGDRKKPWGW